VGGESPKVTKPPTPNVEETAQESLKPSSPDGAQDSPGVGGAPTSPTRVAPSSNPTGASSRPKPTEPPKTSPMSPSPMDLGPSVNTILERARLHPDQKNHRDNIRGSQSHCFDNPEFIQTGFHIGRFIMAAIDTEVDRANTKALYSALESASTHLNVSIF
jgi:hypothetical protein